MTALLAFFLVLVMWAVPSNGRALETECVIHNCALQPYKDNLNLVLCRYDFFYLVLQWSNSFYNSALLQSSPWLRNRFLVHGLWPQRNGVCRVTCPVAFHSQVNLCRRRDLMGWMNDWWPNLRMGPNECFWQHEYNKHGSCFFQSSMSYFDAAHRMWGRIPRLSEFARAVGNGRHTALDFNFLQGRIEYLTGFRPKLECGLQSSGVFLKQIYFCFGRDERLYNCGNGELQSNNIGCGNGIVKLSWLQRPRLGP